MDFKEVLNTWYVENKRKLPWRGIKNPYKIWVSEIILQQTQVVQGLSYYKKFIQLFPDVKQLASASEAEVLNAWQGLGYYSRARNLHFAAKQIVNEYSGIFPDTYKGVLSLKGVGDYTASAISSIAFGLPHAVVDGNVYRFLSRLYGIHTPIDTSAGAKEFKALAQKLLDKKQPGEHNQAVMEFGAMVCRPKNPDCEHCVFIKSCAAFADSTVFELPVKAKKTKVKSRYFYYFLNDDMNNIYLQKRKNKDIWQGLYELPLLETQKKISPAKLQEVFKEKFGGTKIKKLAFEKVHILSHRKIHAYFYSSNFNKQENFTCLTHKKLSGYPISRLSEEFFISENLL